MKYKVNDRVRIKSIDWYNENKDENGVILVENGDYLFCKSDTEWCGRIVTIKEICFNEYYEIVEDFGKYKWTDEMIEGLVEEGTKSEPKFKSGNIVKCSDNSVGVIMDCEWSESAKSYQYFIDYIGTLDMGYQFEKDLQLHSVTTMNGRDIFENAKWKHEFECPEGYQFVDENGNVINATKIVLEKKKKDISLTQEQIDTMVHESCVLFCKHCGCGVPRETCTSLGTCKEHDDYRKSIRTHFEKHKK